MIYQKFRTNNKNLIDYDAAHLYQFLEDHVVLNGDCVVFIFLLSNYLHGLHVVFFSLFRIVLNVRVSDYQILLLPHLGDQILDTRFMTEIK